MLSVLLLIFAVQTDTKVKLKEREKNDKYFDLARRLKKIVEHEGGGYTNCNRCLLVQLLKDWYKDRRT